MKVDAKAKKDTANVTKPKTKTRKNSTLRKKVITDKAVSDEGINYGSQK